jgi:hypothetical protein
LAALFGAEALASGHDLVVAGADGRGNNSETFIESLPFCSSTGSADAAARASSLAAAAAAEPPMEAALELPDSGEVDDGSASKPPSLNVNSAVLSSGYVRAVQAAAAAKDASLDASRKSTKFCHTFDLSRRATPSYVSSLLACNRIRMLKVCADTSPRVSDDILRKSNMPPLARAAVSRMNKADILLQAQIASLRPRHDASSEEKDASYLSPLSSLALTGAILRSLAVERERSGACPYEDLLAQLRPLFGSEETLKDPKPVTAAAQASVSVSRIVLFGLGGVAWPGCTGADVTSLKGCCEKNGARGLSGERQHAAAKPLVNFVSSLSAAVSASRASSKPAVAIVVLPTWALPRAVSGALRARASVVLKLHGVGDPAFASGREYSDPLEAAVATKGFAHAAGVLFVRRLPHWGHAAPQSSVSGDEWIVTRERRRIGLEKPHPPPEDAAPDGASLPCASSGGGKKSIVDF